MVGGRAEAGARTHLEHHHGGAWHLHLDVLLLVPTGQSEEERVRQTKQRRDPSEIWRCAMGKSSDRAFLRGSERGKRQSALPTPGFRVGPRAPTDSNSPPVFLLRVPPVCCRREAVALALATWARAPLLPVAAATRVEIACNGMWGSCSVFLV